MSNRNEIFPPLSTIRHSISSFARYDGWVRILNKHFHKLVKPLPCARRAFKPAAAITLAAGLHPDNRVDMSVVHRRAWLDSEAGGADVAPLTPLGPTVRDTALVNDEPRRQPLGLKVGRQRKRIVVLVVRVAPLGVVGSRVGVEGVVVGDVGREAPNLGVVAGLLDNLGEKFGRYQACQFVVSAVFN